MEDTPDLNSPLVDSGHVCEMQNCERPATHYGGYPGAGDWAGYVCEPHSLKMAWREKLK